MSSTESHPRISFYRSTLHFLVCSEFTGYSDSGISQDESQGREISYTRRVTVRTKLSLATDISVEMRAI
jgi:hypothetical protein